MCTKSPASAERCALLTEGPARHGSCFANFHSFNSPLSCFSSAFRTAEEGHSGTGKLCLLSRRGSSQRQLMKHGSGQNSAEVANVQQTWCLLLVAHLKVMREVQEHFSFCSCFSWNAFPASGALGLLHGDDVLAVRYPCGWQGQGGCKRFEWSQVVSTRLPYSCRTQHHLVHTWSGWWVMPHQLPTSCSPCLHLLKRQQCCWSPSLPEWMLVTCIQVVTFSVALGDTGPESSKQKPQWPFEKFISLFPRWKWKREEIIKTLPYWSCYSMSHLRPDGRRASVPLCATAIWLVTSLCSSRRAASSSLSAAWGVSVNSRGVGWVATGNNVLLVWEAAFCLFLTRSEWQVPKSRDPTKWKAKARKSRAG